MLVLEKSARILVVDRSGQARSSVNACLRDLGFTNCSGVASLSDVIPIMEVEKVDWVISGLQMDGPVNLFQLLNLCLLHKQLNQVMVSALYDDSQNEDLIHLYELGLFSHHAANFSKTALVETFTTLDQRLKRNDLDVCLTAADYLRDAFVKVDRSEELLEFSQRLLSSLPGNAKALLSHAATLAAIGKTEEASAALAQAMIISPEMEKDVTTIKNQYLPGKEIETFQAGTGANLLGITEAVVVDPDEASLNAIRHALDLVGARKVEYFTDPREALKHLENRTTQTLIIQEWKMSKVSGPLFIQKVRQLGHEKTPVIIVSSQVTERDQHLTHEMGVATVVKKPIIEEELMQALIWTMRQELHPTDVKMVERRITGLLARKKPEEARTFAKSLLTEKKITPSIHEFFEAEVCYFKRQFDAAKDHCINALRAGFNSVRIFHLMGKVLMKKRDFHTAIKCFERAQELSPLNIIRLCALADANTEVGNKDAAKDAISKAKDLDPENKAVAITEANYHITYNEVRKASKILQTLEGFEEVISYMNNKGISLAVGGRLQEAIVYYARALDALPDRAERFRPSISYNMGLAYARQGDLAKAQQALQSVAKASDKKLVGKSTSLAKRIRDSMTRGMPLELNTTEPVVAETVASIGEGFVQAAGALTVLSLGPGDRCCYKIFMQAKADPKRQACYTKVPVFRVRTAIVRDESMGIEKGMKAF